MDSPVLADRWLQACPGLTLRACDEGALVFDDKDGRTILLNHQGALVLFALCAAPGVGAAQLQGALSMDNERDTAAFQALMASLTLAGLIAA
ncbi:MAG: hypothetical protein KKH58_06955 [Gammaproteobacteria bacterium]|nr:hypothetical protein [Gammaproteobacteria bacterium]MBU4079826.1 hypothetical protein [Gammaproteobacteria bacterium]